LQQPGTVPTGATNTVYFSMRDGEVISVNRMAALMGHDIAYLNLKGISEAKLRFMLGMSLHRAVIGVLLLGVIAAPGSWGEGLQ